jgi:hypothetical protein
MTPEQMQVVQFTRADFVAILPELILAAAGCLILLIDAFAPNLKRWFSTLALADRWLPLRAVQAPYGTPFGVADFPADASDRSLPGACAALAVLVAAVLNGRARRRASSAALLLWGTGVSS